MLLSDVDLNEEEYIYRPVDEIILYKNANRETSRQRIEIIPFHRNDFDFISFLDFTNLISDTFFATPVAEQKDKTSQIYVYDNDLRQTIMNDEAKYTFFIVFGQNMSFIRIFIKNYMSSFDIFKKNDKLVISLKQKKQSSLTAYESFYYNRINTSTLFKQVSKFFSSNKCKNQCIKSYFTSINNFYDSAPRNARFKYKSLKEVLQYCPGLIRVSYQKKMHSESYTIKASEIENPELQNEALPPEDDLDQEELQTQGNESQEVPQRQDNIANREYLPAQHNNTSHEIAQRQDNNASRQCLQAQHNNANHEHLQAQHNNASQEHLQAQHNNASQDYLQMQYNNASQEYLQAQHNNASQEYLQMQYNNASQEYLQAQHNNASQEYLQMQYNNASQDYLQAQHNNASQEYLQAQHNNASQDYLQAQHNNASQEYLQAQHNNASQEYLQAQHNNASQEETQAQHNNANQESSQARDIIAEQEDSQAQDNNTEQEVEQFELQRLSIVFPWVKELINQVQCIELDASFDGISPYVYCVCHAIFNNESIPISITIAPSERSILFNMIFSGIEEICGAVDWTKKCVLSDMGKAIKASCKAFGLWQVFCHRHIIEHFGSHSALGLFVCRLLRCCSYDQYNETRSEIEKELNEYIEERKILKNYSDYFINKENDLRTMLSYTYGDPNSNYYYERWSLWTRKSHCVPRCSNHSEGFHAVINKSLGSKYSFISKISNIINCTLRHVSNYEAKKGSSLMRKRTSMIETSIEKLKKESTIFSLCKERCLCGEDNYWSSLYGTEIPCSHQVLFKAREIIIVIHQKIESTKQSITINQIVIMILEKIKNKSKKALDVNDIFNNDTLKEIKIEKELLNALINKIQSCFEFTQPKFPKFSMNWSDNNIKEAISKDILVFKKSVKKSPHPLFKLSKSDENCWTKNCQTYNQKLAKVSLYETLNEALYIYPEVANPSEFYSICVDNYATFINYNDDKSIIDSIPKFKINCWKAIDLHMKDNRFFK